MKTPGRMRRIGRRRDAGPSRYTASSENPISSNSVSSESPRSESACSAGKPINAKMPGKATSAAIAITAAKVAASVSPMASA